MGLISRFIVELRRRAIFRTGGFYIGICWILVQVASIIYPAFDAPDWSMRATVVGAIVAFPVVLVLAWFLVPLHGRDTVGVESGTEESLRFGSRSADFAVIGVLAIALSFSIYLNINQRPDYQPPNAVIRVLIADLENSTGESVYDRVFERVLSVGLEESGFISTEGRKIVNELGTRYSDSTSLDSGTARALAFDQRFDRLILSAIKIRGDQREITVTLIAPNTSEELASFSASINSSNQFLSAVGKLVFEIRLFLGDRDVQETSASLPWLRDSDLYAWKALALGDSFYFSNELLEESNVHLSRAIRLSPDFARAHHGLALNAWNLGLEEEARTHFRNVIASAGWLTERETLQFQGFFYLLVERDNQKAAEVYQQLVDNYPADEIGHNNLAVLHFFERDFDAAFKSGQKAIDWYPEAPMYLTNYALYGMYSSNLSLALNQARLSLQTDPTFNLAWLPIAMSAMDVGDVAGARSAYENMIQSAEQSEDRIPNGVATGVLGLADSETVAGRFESARRELSGLAERLMREDNRYMATTVYAAIADTYGAEGRLPEAVSAAEDGLSILTESEAGRMYPVETIAALHYVNAQRFEEATSIARRFGESSSSGDQAFGLTIEGLIQLHRQEHESAIQSFDRALQLTDLWLTHFMLGRAHLASKSYEKALSEFQLCHARRGEAMAMFLDDVPTYRVIVPLKYWTAQAQASLGLTTDAISNLEDFLELRPNGGQYVEEARDLLSQLHGI